MGRWGLAPQTFCSKVGVGGKYLTSGLNGHTGIMPTKKNTSKKKENKDWVEVNMALSSCFYVTSVFFPSPPCNIPTPLKS